MCGQRFRRARPLLTRRCALGAVVVGLAVFLAAPTARADRVTELIRILRSDPSYKVRLQAVIGLGRLKDKRSVPALIQIGLADDNYTVRGLAATALGAMGDKQVAAALKRALQREKHEFVRTQITKALKTIDSGGGGDDGLGPGVRFHVSVGKMANKSGKGGTQLSRALEDSLLKEFRKVAGVSTTGRPKVADLRKRRIKAFVLDGAVLEATGRRSGSSVEVSCTIRVSLATLPDNSMKAFYSGGAAMQVSSGEFKPETEVSLFKEVIAGAATGARQQIVSSYLSAQ